MICSCVTNFQQLLTRVRPYWTAGASCRDTPRSSVDSDLFEWAKSAQRLEVCCPESDYRLENEFPFLVFYNKTSLDNSYKNFIQNTESSQLDVSEINKKSEVQCETRRNFYTCFWPVCKIWIFHRGECLKPMKFCIRVQQCCQHFSLITPIDLCSNQRLGWDRKDLHLVN